MFTAPAHAKNKLLSNAAAWKVYVTMEALILLHTVCHVHLENV